MVIPPELCDWWWPASGGSAPSEKTRPGILEHVSCGFWYAVSTFLEASFRIQEPGSRIKDQGSSTWYPVLGTRYWVPGTWYQVLVTEYLVPSTWSKYLVQVLGTKYLVPSTWYVPSAWYQVLGTKYFVPITWYQVPGTKYLVPGTWYRKVTACGKRQAAVSGKLK